MAVRDFADNDLLVIPVTSHPVRTTTDVVLNQWREAGLKLPSTVRVEKLTTIDKSCVIRKLGALLPNDLAAVQKTLTTVCKLIME